MIDLDDELMRPCICGCMILTCYWRFFPHAFWEHHDEGFAEENLITAALGKHKMNGRGVTE